nr:uncharacterized protein LOC119623137 [Chlorocebus sabaeus]
MEAQSETLEGSTGIPMIPSAVRNTAGLNSTQQGKSAAQFIVSQTQLLPGCAGRTQGEVVVHWCPLLFLHKFAFQEATRSRRTGLRDALQSDFAVGCGRQQKELGIHWPRSPPRSGAEDTARFLQAVAPASSAPQGGSAQLPHPAGGADRLRLPGAQACGGRRPRRRREPGRPAAFCLVLPPLQASPSGLRLAVLFSVGRLTGPSVWTTCAHFSPRFLCTPGPGTAALGSPQLNCAGSEGASRGPLSSLRAQPTWSGAKNELPRFSVTQFVARHMLKRPPYSLRHDCGITPLITYNSL